VSARVLIVEADGGSRGNPGHAGYGSVVLDGATGVVLAERAGYVGIATNNVAEYRGLIAGLKAARAIDPEAHLQVRLDSKLVVEQMSGRWKIKHPDMLPLALEAREIASGTDVVYAWIPRESNKRADALANEAMDTRHPDIRRDFEHGEPTTGEELAEKPVESTTTGAAPPRIAADTPVAAPGTRRDALFTVKGDELVSPLTLVLVRHGVTDMTIGGHLSGSSAAGPALNAAGRVQAAKAADAVYRIGRQTWERVPKVTRVLASPMVRTQETGAAIGRRIGAPVEIEDRLREINFGEWEGLAPDTLAEASGDAIHRWRFGEIPAPGGESIPEVGARMNTLVEDLAAEHGRLCADGADEPRAYVLTSHAVAIKSAIGYSLGIDTRQWGSIWPQPASLTLLQLRVTQDGTIAERHLLCLGAPID
jgi:broad specificity phosphatase PhoE/ribonuclease HI